MSFIDMLNYQRYNGSIVITKSKCKGSNSLCAMFVRWGYV
jgi:hypothetical protein